LPKDLEWTRDCLERIPFKGSLQKSNETKKTHVQRNHIRSNGETQADVGENAQLVEGSGQ
jgi:hypothetical protein